MSINETNNLQISSCFKEEYRTTDELKKLDLYYTFRNDLRIDVYIKLKSGIMKKKTVYTSKKDTQYISHKGSNYTLSTILDNAINGTQLEKGIDKVFSPRNRFVERRVKKKSLFSRFLDWFEGKLS
jgi:hypothetical protein